MPHSILDYVPLATSVIAHWNQVEQKTEKPLLLKDKTTLAGFMELKDRLVTLNSQNLVESNTRQRAQEQRDTTLKALHPLVKQARTSVKGQAGELPGFKALPALLPVGTDPQKYLQAARDIAEIWATLNTQSDEPLTIPLRDGEETVQITHAAFVVAIHAYESAVAALVAAKSAEELGRKTRDGLHKLVHAKLVAYPLAAKARLADGDPLRATIPTLTG